MAKRTQNMLHFSTTKYCRNTVVIDGHFYS